MRFVTIDFESYYEEGGKDAYSIKNMTTSAYIKDPRFRALGLSLKVDDKPAMYIEERDITRVLDGIQPQLEKCFLLAHHQQFDGLILAYRYGIRPAMYGCTLAMASALKVNIGTYAGGSLAALMKRFNLGEKGILTPDSSPEELRIRATIDAEACYQLFGIFRRAFNFPADALKEIDWTIRCFCDPIIMADVPKLYKIREEYAIKMQGLLDRVGYSIDDLRSPTKFASALESLGVRPPLKLSPNRNTPSKEIFAFAKTDEEFVELLESEDDDVSMLAEARLASKGDGESNRAARFLDLAEFGCMPVYLKYASPHTLRWAGGDKINWQNFKRGGSIRDALIAPPGYVYIVGDSAQIEARATAWLCQCKLMLECFADPKRDLYCEFGSMAWQRAITKANEYERFSSKTVVLGCGFGAGGRTIFQQMRAEIRKREMKIPVPDESVATMLVQHYRNTFTEIRDGWQVVESLLGNPGATFGPIVSTGDTWRLPNGLAVVFTDLQKEYFQMKGENKFGWRYDTERGRTSTWGGKLMENAASSLSKCVMGWQLLKLDPIMRGLGGKIASMSHDEFIVLVPRKNVDTASQAMQYWMTQGPEWSKGWPIACEVKIGDTYAEAK